MRDGVKLHTVLLVPKGLRDAPILLDDEKLLPNVLGLTGTPSAILIDEENRIVSEVAAGAAQLQVFADDVDDVGRVGIRGAHRVIVGRSATRAAALALTTAAAGS